MPNKQELSERITRLKIFLLKHPNGVHIDAIVKHMGMDKGTVYRDLDSIGAIHGTGKDGMWAYTPKTDELEFAEAIYNAVGKNTPRKAKAKQNPHRAIHVIVPDGEQAEWQG